MSIVSFRFFLFVAVMVAVYYLAPRSGRWVTLLLGSAVFIIMGSSWRLYMVFLSQVMLAYTGALLLHEYRQYGKWICGIVIAGEIACLTMLKESSFFITTARYALTILGRPYEIPYLELAAPMAISYYTLMLISYVLDVHWEKIPLEKNPLKLVLYAGFFPQMVAGPVSRYAETAVQLYEGHRFDYKQFCFGIQRVLWGLFKKLVLAERLGIIVKTIYGGGLQGTWTPVGSYVLIGAAAYTFQLYNDFSGGIDIALGVAQMLGIVLPENFNTPFYSTSMSEIWRRWHITLGLWLRDYIYIPLGGSRVSRGRLILNLFVVWSVTGFWHGGSYKWLFWGLMTFAVIAGGKILQPVFNKIKTLLRINTEAASWTLFGRLRTVFLFMVLFSVQPAAGLLNALRMWKNAFVFNPWVFVDGSLYQLGLDRIDFWIMIFGLLLLFVVSKYQQKGSVRETIAKQNLVFRWMLWIGLLMAVLLFGMYGEGYNPADFIYGGF